MNKGLATFNTPKKRLDEVKTRVSTTQAATSQGFYETEPSVSKDTTGQPSFFESRITMGRNTTMSSNKQKKKPSRKAETYIVYPNQTDLSIEVIEEEKVGGLFKD